MNQKRKRHSANVKARVALEVFKGDQTASELISTYKVSSGQLSTWKKTLVQGAAQIFENNQKTLDQEAITAPLYQEIGRLKMELDWLKKKSAQFRGQ